MIGYNSSQIEGLRGTVEGLAQESAELVIGTLKYALVVPMTAVWYAPEGVDFFTKLAEEVKRVEPEFRGAFEDFVRHATRALKNWMDNTGAQAADGLLKLGDTSFEALSLDLDVSSIKSKNPEGQVGIIAESARNIAGQLSEHQTTLNEGLTAIAQKLDASTTFIGGDQAEAAKACLVTLTKAAGKIFNFLTEGNAETKSMQTIINEVAEKYETVASNVSSSFNGTTEPTA